MTLQTRLKAASLSLPRLVAMAAMVLPTAALSLSVNNGPAHAHFQLAHTDTALPEKADEMPVGLIFWHPFENGHVMDMEQPDAVYAIHRGKKIDLMDSLVEAPFTGAENTGKAYQATLPVRRSGDYVLMVHPVPYMEATEDIYIQQFTKNFVNFGGVPTDWSAPVGAPTEILPLNNPTNLIAGSTFTGVVLSEGKPVANAEIEVEYLAATPNLTTNAAEPAVVSAMPGGAVTIFTDANGSFTFGLPKAGVWGFAALGVGPVAEHDGKELSQDAVIWVHAHELTPTGTEGQ